MRHLLPAILIASHVALSIPDDARQSPPPVKVAQEADLDGIYHCSGQETKPYEGAAIIKKVGDIYVVQWTTGAAGIGVRTGDSLSVGWFQEGTRGVTVYKIDGKKLTGRWASMPGKGRVNPETLEFMLNWLSKRQPGSVPAGGDTR